MKILKSVRFVEESLQVKIITGLCPKHQKGLNDGAAVVGIGVMALGLKKFGPKILKGTVKLIKR